MTTTFQKVDQLDYVFDNGADSYHIEQFDNGVRFELRLIHSKSGKCVDSHNLEWGLMLPQFVDSAFYNHKVIKGVFDRTEWNDDACPHILKIVEDRINANNQQSLIDYLEEHNKFNESYMETMRQVAQAN
jgi:hypothetical protein